MYKNAHALVVCVIIFMMSGCASATDRDLSPPKDTQWVNIEIKNPSQYTRPFPLEVLYISNTCKRKLMSMRDGQHYEKAGYNPTKIPLQQKDSSDIWVAKVAMNGGGKCNWVLSEFNLGIEYIDASHLGKDLVPGTAVGVTIAFDDNIKRNGKFELVNENNLTISPQYYPVTESNKRISDRDTLSLFGKENFLQQRIVASSGDVNIAFSPKLDESKIVKMIAPKEHKVGAFYKIEYPDGTVSSDGSTHPDFNKIDSMTLK